MTRTTALAILAAAALVDLTFALPWDHPAITAVVVIHLVRLALPVVGVVTRRRWILYLGALVALACWVFLWFIVFVAPAIPIACLIVARHVDPAPRGSHPTTATDVQEHSTGLDRPE